MNELLNTLASLTNSPGELFTPRWQAILLHFKDYDPKLLGRHVHHHVFANGIESKAVVTHFPQVICTLRSDSNVPPHINRGDRRKLRDEFECWVAELSAAEKPMGGFDLNIAQQLVVTEYGKVIFLPKHRFAP